MTNEGSKSITFMTVKDEGLALLDSIRTGMKVDIY